MVNIIFDETKDYTDPSKLGYGAGFSVAYSSGLSHASITKAVRGTRVEKLEKSANTSFSTSQYAYIVDYRDSHSQHLLFQLLAKNSLVQTSFSSFSVQTGNGTKDFSYGSLLIPVSNQTISPDELYATLQKLAVASDVEIISVSTGYSVKGVDLGSSAFRTVEQPKVLVITGGNISSTEAGEVWHLFDQKLNYQLTRADYNVFPRIPLNSFNRIVLAGGDYSFLGKQGIQDLQNWVRNGGTLITINSASRWAVNNGISAVQLQKLKTDSLQQKQSEQQFSQERDRIPTSVFETKINLKHPLAFGLTNESLPVTRESSLFLAPSKNPSATVSVYSDTPLLNGYISASQLSNLTGSTSIIAERQGSGNIVLFAEDPLFRGIWDATARTFVNAVVFGNNINAYNSFR